MNQQKTKSAYLDSSTVAQPSKAAVSAMIPYLSDRWGGLMAPHSRGQKLYPSLAEAMKSIIQLLGVEEDDGDLILTSSGAEAINQVVNSVYQDVTRNVGKNHFLAARTDEAPAIVAMGLLEEHGCVAKLLEVDQHGAVTIETLAEGLTPRTALLSLSWGNGLTGVMHDLVPLAEMCRDRGVLLHLDMTHVLGKIFFDLAEIQPDYVTFNGEQLHAPSGSGALWVKKGARILPFIAGGTDQASLRGGNLNLPAVVALGVAADEAIEARDYMCTEIARLRNKLEQGILAGSSQANLFFSEDERVPHISVIAFKGLANEALAYALDRLGVAVSIGGGTLQQLGMNLIAAGVDEVLAHSALSFSLSRFSTDEEIDYAIKMVTQETNRLTILSNSLFQQEAVIN